MSDNRGAEVSSARPESLPWLIRLDKYVDDQNHGGAEEFVVRGNQSATALNEALALDLLDQTGLAATQAIATAFAVNGSAPALRLVVENPNTAWMERELGDGFLYKAEPEGDYRYRGDDPDAYAAAWDQEGGEDNLEPLVEFLRLVNESTDADFAANLEDWLDVDAFATYLAFQSLVGNPDDIDGPGNNSYLFWDPESQRMTVVNWDLNLAFDATFDERQTGTNVLAERFLAEPGFAAKYEAERERLRTELIESGFAADSLNSWTQLLLTEAGSLIVTELVAADSAALAAQIGRAS